MTSGARAFSLVELLVTISIVAVLATLAFPALNRALNRARTARCAANLGQWGLAYVQYTVDNDGALPNARPNGEATWQDGLAPYLQGPTGTRNTLRAKLGCPADKLPDWKYGNNEYLDAAGGYTHVPARIWALPSRINFVIIADSGVNFWSVEASTGSSGIDYTRHGGLANFCFADSHVETLSLAAARARAMGIVPQ